MDFLTDPIFSDFGRSDFIGGIDNEALDFGHLEQYIHIRQGPTDPTHLEHADHSNVSAQSHLPESPPDSGSEPPYSPAELHSLPLATDDPVGSLENAGQGAPFLPLNVNINHHSTPVRRSLENEIAVLSNISSGGLEMGMALPALLQSNETYNDHLHPIVGSITIRKHEDMLTGNVLTSEEQYRIPLLTHSKSSDHQLDLDGYREVQTPQSNLIQSHNALNNTLNSILPDDYCMGIIHESTKAIPHSIPDTPNANVRKRKVSNSDSAGSQSQIKPEPNSTSQSPMCKRKVDPSLSPAMSTSLSHTPPSSYDSNIPSTVLAAKAAAADNSLDGSQNPDSTDQNNPMQCIRFSVFQPQNWHHLCDKNLQDLALPHYRVDADKGFNFSNSDDAFVCQKKNHFQITCHAQLQGEASFVRTPTGLEKIKSFHLHFYGVKLEAPNQIIRVEQSQSDRSKKPFHPVPIDIQNHLVSKVTVGRLHFSETTSNNMRKKGRPNPEQRYFQLVVGLHAHTQSGHFPIVSQGSERIIVRASNPGQFESDVELCWQRGMTQDSIYHAGRVGINTDHPDESLVVHGNLKISGHIVQPSDSRAKQEIAELDTAQQLQNLQKIRIVKYRYEPEFAQHSGLKVDMDTGVIAQEVREVLPDAVQEAGSIVLPSGQVIEKFLLVNKDRILMENIGAVKELCKVTGSLETRIEQLEKINTRLIRMQQTDKRSSKCSVRKCKHSTDDCDEEADEICSNKTIQLIIIALVIIMAICLAAISTLYFIEHGKQRYFKRFDHYDISQIVAHDSILINNKNRNSHLDFYNLDRRPPYLNSKNSKMISTIYTNRPDKSSASTTPGSFDDYNLDGLSKTASSKNKIKWPLAAAATIGPPSSASEDSESSEDFSKIISKETSSERIVESIILPQDVENNSIDGDVPQKAPTTSSGKPLSSKKSLLTDNSNGISTDEVFSNGLNANEDAGNHSISTQKQEESIYSAFKKHRDIEPSTATGQTDLANEALISNKSQANNEDTDLQYLNSNKELEDRAFYEFAMGGVERKIIIRHPLGAKEGCSTKERFRSQCRSACEETAKSSKPYIATSTTVRPATRALTTSSSKSNDTIRKTSLSDKPIECLLITPWIRGETFNMSLDAEEVCSNGQNYNITYVIPLSKYADETNMELGFVTKGSPAFQLKICKDMVEGHSNQEKKAQIAEGNGKPFQKYPNKSIFNINFPEMGFFEYFIELRSSLDSVKNVCNELMEEATTIQYNIHIYRDCD